MAAADEGRLAFGASLEPDAFINGIEEIKDSINDLSAYAEQMGRTLDNVGKEGGATMQEFAASAKEVGETLEQAWGKLDQLADQNRTSVKALEKEYEELSRQAGAAFQQGNDDEYRRLQERQQAITQEVAKRKELQATINAVGDKLAEQQQTYDQVTAKTQKYADSSTRLRTQLRGITEQLQRMRVEAYEAGGEQAVAAVKASKAYQDLANKAAALRDIQGDVSSEISKMAHDNGALQGIISGVSGITGAFSAAQGAVGLFVGESEDLQKVMVKVQSLMAIMMGLQQVMNTLNKDSAFMTWLASLEAKTAGVTTATAAETVATEANAAAHTENAAAVAAESSAKKGLVGSTNAATGAQTANTTATTSGAKNVTGLTSKLGNLGKAFKLLLNPITLLIAAFAGLAAAFALIYKKKVVEPIQKIRKEFAEVADSAAKPVATIKKFKSEWDSLGDDMEKRKKFIKENKEELRKLGLAIENVNQAEKVFRDHTDAWISAQISRAKASAAIKQAEEKAAELLKAQNVLDTTPRTIERSVVNARTGTVTSWIDNNPAYDRALKKVEKIRNELEKIYKDIAKYEQEAEQTEADVRTAAGVKTEEEIKAEEEARKRAKAAADEKKRLQEDALKQEEAYGKKLRSLTEQMVAEQVEAEIDAMNEGYAKKLALIRLNYAKELDEINKERAELLKASQDKAWAAYLAGHQGDKNNKGKEAEIRGSVVLDEETQNLLNERAQQATERRIAAEERLNKELMQSFIQEYGDFTQKRKKIDEEYEADRALIATRGDAKMLEKRTKAYKRALSDLARASLDSDTWTKFFENADKMTIQEVNELLGELADTANSDNEAIRNLSEDAVTELTDKLNDLKNKVQEDNPFLTLSEAIKKFKEDQTEANFDNMVAAMGDVQKTLQPLIDSFGELFSAMSDGDQAVEDFTGTINAMVQGLQQGGILGMVISGVVSVLATMVKMIAQAVKEGKERPFKDWQKDMEESEETLKRLQKASDKLFGQSLVNNYKRQSNELASMMRETQQTIDEMEEEARKKGKQHGMNEETGLKAFQESDTYKELTSSLEDYQDQIKQLQEAMGEAIYGETIASAIERFESAYSDAWMSGTSAAQASAELIADTFKQIADEAAKDALETSGVVKQLRELAKLYSQIKLGSQVNGYVNVAGHRMHSKAGILAYEASGLSEYGISYDEYFSLSPDELMQRIREYAEKAGLIATEIFDKLNIATEAERNGTAQGIATASQESVDELNGRMTAIQGHTFNLSSNSDIMRDNVQAMLSTVQGIKIDTAYLQGMASDLGYIKQNVQRLNR